MHSRSAGVLGRSPHAPAVLTDTANKHVGRSHARSLPDIPIALPPCTAQAPALSNKRHSTGAQLSSVPEASTLSGG